MRRERAETLPTGHREPSSPRPLTDRQLEILVNAARGRTNRQIGEVLGISERTVRNHMREILKRLSGSDRTHAVVLAIGNGWISIPIEPDSPPVVERPDRSPPTVAVMTEAVSEPL